MKRVGLRSRLVAVVKSRQWGWLAALGAAVGLSFILYPALWDGVLGGALEKLLPPQIYHAIHELRHLWGVPCH